MKILELRLTNFMPYRGDHVVSFPDDVDRNVMLVFGENMRGKTSFLNAIRWCLYGEALDRNRKPIALHNLVNMDARDAGEWSFEVRLSFLEAGVLYDLSRRSTPRESVTTPKRDSDYVTVLQLLKDLTPIRVDEIEHEVNQVLPQQTSRFFLFDAELLAEYEELLSQESEQGKRIKEAIEQVLGVPALVHGRSELRTLQRTAQEVLAKESKHSKATSAQAELFNTLGVQLEALQKDFESLRRQEDTARNEITELETELSRTEGAEKLRVRLDGLRSERKRRQDRQRQCEEERFDAVATAWRDLLQPRVQAHVRSLESKRQGYISDMESRGVLRERIDQYKAVLSDSKCRVCEQPVADSARKKFSARLAESEVQLKEAVANIEAAGRITADIGRLTIISSTNALSRLAACEADLDRIAVEITRSDEEMRDLQNEVESFDSTEAARKRARLKQLFQHIGMLQADVVKTKESIEELETKRDGLSRLMGNAPSERTRRSALEVEVYNGLERLFARSVDLLRDRLRTTVQARATDAFKQLTTEKSYSALQLNESYGLTILDRNNRAVSIRSAGAEQIVALSLIDGLNRTARKTGPIIIDTPLGRLDPKHRSNVLDYVATMAEQVILLVHEGEMSRDGDREALRGRIGRVYEIERLSSSHSRLVRT